MSAIQVKHLTKHYKTLNRSEGVWGAIHDLFSRDYKLVRAVDDISFEIEPGEIVGYIGPNGAGKSTTIKMMTGILRPTSGTLLVDGHVPFENRKRNAQRIGVIFGQRTQLWWDLPVIESFKILKEIYHIDDRKYKSQLDRFNDLINLQQLYSTPVRTLSLGQRMLCDIVAAFLHSPSIIFLDEPTIGLDVSVKSNIRSVIKTLNAEQNVTIILTTHDLSDIEALTKRIIIIDKGKVLYDGETEKVTELFGQYRTLKIQIHPFTEDTQSSLQIALDRQFNYEGAIKVESTEEGWIDVTINQELIALLEVLSYIMGQFQVKDIKVVEISMENVVHSIYSGGLNETILSTY